ncbi:unnamed protein product, partial [Ixodes pacificus]
VNNCHSQLALFLRERNCKTLSVMAEAADHYLKAQCQRKLLLFRKAPESEKSKDDSGEATKKPQFRCLVFDKKGHKASDSRSKPTKLYCVYCRRPGNLQACRKNSNNPREASSCVSPKNLRYESQQAGRNKPKGKKRRPKRTIETHDMPVVEGELLGQAVSVLRDTGSNTLIVRRSLVPETALTGSKSTLLLVDGTQLEVPEAKVDIASPYFKGTAIVKCLEAPLYDVIVG